MKFIHYIAWAVMLLSLSMHAAANPLLGKWVSEDNSSIITVLPCYDSAKTDTQYCGYIAGFQPSGNTLDDRAFCGFRLMGGLKEDGAKLTKGWLIDPQTDAVYNVKLSAGRTPSQLTVYVYGKIKALGEKIAWSRYETSQDQSSVSPIPLCGHPAQ